MTVSLSRYMVRASLPMSDLDRAKRFYEAQLGLSALEEQVG
jgi:hypothetical protein